MGTSDITVTALTASPGIGHIALKFTVSDPRNGALPNLALDVVEVWAASSNDRSLAAKIDEGKDKAAHMALTEGQVWYYWAKARNKTGNYGDWYPSGATSGVQGTVGFASGYSSKNLTLVASVSAGALTIAAKTVSGNDPSADNPIPISFVSEFGNGTPESVSQTSAVSLVIPSGATLGAVANAPLRLWFVALKKTSTEWQIGVKNCAGIASLNDGYDPNTTAAIDTGSDSSNALYATTHTAGSPKPFRIIGWAEWNANSLPTPGTWTAPNRLYLFSAGMSRPGDVLNLENRIMTAVYSGATQIPLDDTIPLSAEILRFNSLQPVFSANYSTKEYVRLTGVINCSYSVVSKMVAGLYDSLSDAVFVCGWSYCSEINGICQISFDYFGPLYGLGTLDIFVGGVASGTVTVNGTGAARKLGGVLTSSVIATVVRG